VLAAAPEASSHEEGGVTPVILVLLGVIAGACAMYLWCRRAVLVTSFHGEVLASTCEHDPEVRVVFDERTYCLTPDDALGLGEAIVSAARDTGAARRAA
jgi:hypothetical protein